MSDLDNAINSINASAAKAENTATFLDDMSTFDDQSSVTNPNNGQTVASIPKQVKDRTDELFAAAESDINQSVSDAAQSATDAQDAADSIGRYQGLWPDTGGSADKGDTYQTQVGGTPTGEYYTALQNTSVDPVGDDVNWKAQNDYGNVAAVFSSVANMADGTVSGGKITHKVGYNYIVASKLNSYTVYTVVSEPANVPLNGGLNARKLSSLRNTIFDDDLNPAYDKAIVMQRRADNNPVRFYLLPKGEPTGNTRSSFKLFGTDFVEDPVNYEDFNLTFVNTLNGGTVGNADKRAVLVNLKTGPSGIYRSNPSDVVFGFDDLLSGDENTPSANIAGRFWQNLDGGQAYCGFIIGKRPIVLSKTTDVLFIDGNAGIAHNKGVRHEGSDGVGDTVTNRLNTSNQIEDQIRSGFTFVRDQYGRMKQSIVNTLTFSAPHSESKQYSMRDGGYQKTYLTADMTVATINNITDGDEITLQFTADASSRVVTWPSPWTTQSTSITVNANTTTIVKFRSDGAKMVQQSIVEGLS